MAMVMARVYQFKEVQKGSFKSFESAIAWLEEQGLTQGNQPSVIGMITHPESYCLVSLQDLAMTANSRARKLLWLNQQEV